MRILLLPFTFCTLVLSSAQAQPGSIDLDFTSGFAAQGVAGVEAIALQPDGKIIAVGAFYAHEGDSCRGVVRINTDGSRDASFDAGSGLLDSFAEINGYSGRGRAVAVQADGKILLGGSFVTYNGIIARYMVRLNPDGSIDESFNTLGTGFNGPVFDIQVQADGSIVCCGSFSSYNGFSRNKVARLLPDGTLDPSFVSPAIDVSAFKMALQSDGKVLVCGTFTTVGGTAVGRLARLNTDGSLDTDFSSGGGGNLLVMAIHVMDDGRIMVGGGFTEYNGIPSVRIARLLPDGTVDATFQANIGSNPNQVRAIVEQADGKYLALGSFEVVNGYAFRNVVRLNPTGTVDLSFFPGAGFSNVVQDALLQPDGKLVGGGFFNAYDAVLRPSVARVNTSGTAAIAEEQGMAFAVFPNPTNGIVTIRGEFDGELDLVVLDASGRLMYEVRMQGNGAEPLQVDLGALDAGVYVVQLRAKDRVATRTLVKE